MKFNYVEEAHQTVSPNFFGDLVEAGVVKGIFEDYIRVSNQLDIVKKTLFYGKELGDIEKMYRENSDESVTADYFDNNIIHGIIGAATETGELMEALYKKVFGGQEFDIVNMGEEVGDVEWYLALLVSKAGVTFDEVHRNNIKKLRKRYPDNFTKYDAENRDLDGEREILEELISQASDDTSNE